MKTKKKQPTPKRKTAKPRREYLVGYVGDGETVTGLGGGHICRTSIREAHKRASDLISPRKSVCIYRLVPVAVGRVVNGKFVERKPSPKAKPKAVADEPMVTGPHQLGGMWDIRTSSHYWHPNRAIWMRRDDTRYTMGLCVTEAIARRALPAACKAWAEMHKSGGAK